jgi:hypothetical protein
VHDVPAIGFVYVFLFNDGDSRGIPGDLNLALSFRDDLDSTKFSLLLNRPTSISKNVTSDSLTL